MYPHLLDLIVDQAPYTSLVRLRACSRHLRTRADALLNGPRLIISHSKPVTHTHYITIVSRPEGRVPAFMSWESTSRHRAHDLALLSTVDVIGPALPLSLSFFFPHPAQTVRLLPDSEGHDAFSHPYSPWDAAMTMPSYTLVRWVPLVRLMHCRHQRWRDYLFPGLVQLVLNIPFNTDDTLQALDSPHILPITLEPEGSHGPDEVVYIFHPGRSTLRYEPPSLEFHSDTRKPHS